VFVAIDPFISCIFH